MRLGVEHGAWSKAINLENIGLHHAFHVLGPPQAVGRSQQLTGSTTDSIVHFDCERVIAPRGFSPRRGRFVSQQSQAKEPMLQEMCVNDAYLCNARHSALACAEHWLSSRVLFAAVMMLMPRWIDTSSA